MLSGSDAADFQSQLIQHLVAHFQSLGITPRIKIQNDLMQVLVEASQVPEAVIVMPVVQRELEAYANFTHANLQGSIFANTTITGAILPNGQHFDSGIDLQRYTER